MNLALGQIYAHTKTGQEVVVIQLRDETHAGGLGAGYGTMAIAYPIRPGQSVLPPDDEMHPFDAFILCDALPSHGDERWRLVEDRHFEGVLVQDGPLL